MSRRARIAASILALLAGATAWLSAGIVGFTSGGADRVAAFPSLSLLLIAMLAALAAAKALALHIEAAWPLAISFLIWLPFLPGPIPSVFMLFQGPIEALVWALVAAGLIFARPRTVPGILADPRPASWAAAVFAIALSAWAFTALRNVVPGGDEPHYLVATQSLLADRDLRVENNYAAGSYLEYFGGRLQPHFLQRSTSGEIYSIHSPGVSVVVLPAFAVAGHAGAAIMVILIAGFTAALTWITAWRVSGSVAGAWVGAAAVFATAPFIFHTFTIYPDGMGALLVMAGMWLIVRLDQSWDPSPRMLLGIGAALAILPWLHTRFALLSATLAVITIARLALRPLAMSRVAVLLAVPVVAAAAWFAYFWVIWGTPSPAAPYGKDLDSSLTYIGRGVTGLLVDQQFGVITTAPVSAMALMGLVVLLRRRPRLAIELVVIAVPYVLAVSTYAMWWGGTSAPARFIAAILPLAAIAIACAWSVAWLRAVTLLLLLVSAALIVPRLTVDAGRLVFNSRHLFDPTFEWLALHVDLAMALPSVHRDGVAGAWLDAAPWLIAIACVAIDAFAISRMRAGRGAAWALTAFSGAVLVMASTWIVWTVHGIAGPARDRSALALWGAFRPWHVSFLDAGRARPMPRVEFLQRLAIEAPAERNAALLRLARVPAGEYVVEGTTPTADGKLAVFVGPNNALLESVTGPVLTLRLPVAVSSLSMRADSTAADGASAMRVRPLQVHEPANADGRSAVRAARYGRARAFVFDERVYLEPTGFWTRAEGSATLVIDADDAARQAGLPIAFTAGAAATTIGISVGEWSQSYSLTPGERREVTLPPLGDAAAWEVHIHSGPGFRPFEREPGNADVRALAAWFEIP